MRAEFDEFLRIVRAQFARPVLHRPLAFVAACDELRRAFRHGRMPTKSMLQLKSAFEAEVATVECEVAKLFVKCVSGLVVELELDDQLCAA